MFWHVLENECTDTQVPQWKEPKSGTRKLSPFQSPPLLHLPSPHSKGISQSPCLRVCYQGNQNQGSILSEEHQIPPSLQKSSLSTKASGINHFLSRFNTICTCFNLMSLLWAPGEEEFFYTALNSLGCSTQSLMQTRCSINVCWLNEE